MSSDLKHELIQPVTNALSNPEAAKAAGLIGITYNVAEYIAGNANILVALSTLFITWSMYYWSKRKTKQDTATAKAREEAALSQTKLNQAQEALLMAKLKKMESEK